MKKVLGEIKAEVNVLSRTETILKSRTTNLDQFNRQMEQNAGVSGFSKVQDKIEDIADNQANVDKNKDETLQEITKIVNEIETKIKVKKQ